MLAREDILQRVPHQGDMCLWDEVLAWTATDIVLRARNHRDPAHPLRSDGRLRAIHLCEYGAQAMAVHGGLRARQPEHDAGGVAGLLDRGLDPRGARELRHQPRPAQPEPAPPQIPDQALVARRLRLRRTEIHLAEIRDQPRRIVQQEGTERHRLAEAKGDLRLRRPIFEGAAPGLQPRQPRQLLRRHRQRQPERAQQRDNARSVSHACSVFGPYSAAGARRTASARP